MGRAPTPVTHALRYGMAVALVTAAAVLSVVIRQSTEGSPFILFFLAAVLAARFAGLGPGALATILGGVAAKYLLMPPLHSLAISPGVAFDLVGFLIVGGVACWVTAALGTAENRLKRVLDSISEGFVVIDPEWRCVYANHQAAEIVGKRPEELIDKGMLEVFPQAREMPFFAALQEAMIDRRPARIEVEIPSRDAWFEGRVMPTKKGIAVFIQDVSDRVRVHHQLETTLADLARSNQELEKFASTLSHDWVQPLSSIMTYASLLEDQATGDNQRYARTIIEAAHRMSVLLRVRRDDSKAGAHPDDLESTPLEPILEAVERALEGVLAGKGITVESDGLPTVRAEPLLMRQLLHSLISSRVKTSGPGCLRFSAELETERWIISLRSRCKPGLSDSRAPDEADDDLAISKRIVELHRGRLWCEIDAEGATIRFILPVDHPIPVASP